MPENASDKAVSSKVTRSSITESLRARMTFLNRTQVDAVVDGVFDELSKAIGNGRAVEIRGLGSFAVMPVAGRKVRNPRTGQEGYSQARRRVRFRPGRELKEALSRPS